jgi:uncharacterized protein (TIGR02001 family)
MTKKFTKTMVAAVLASGAGTAVALDDISANVALGTDYIFRGVSQTDSGPAISGGFDWAYDTGWNGLSLYAGTWGSNIDPQFFGGDSKPSMELDGYLGLSGSLGEIGYDVGWLRYFYPGGGFNDTSEWHIGGSWRWFGATYYYSKDWFGTGGDSASRIEGSFDYELPYGIALTASVANNYGDGIEDFFVDSYVDWLVGVSKPWLGVDWAFTYTDTNISQSDCGGQSLCDSAFNVSVSKSF